jgi:DNA-binding transcriptional regulator GbsR (MarR family)
MELKKILAIMNDNQTGLSITEIVKLTNQSRSAVRIGLARLEGANKIKSRRIGMAKVYILNPDIPETQSQLADEYLNPAITSKPQSNSKIKIKTQIYGGM